MVSMPIQNPPVPPSEITGRTPNTDVPVTLLANVDRPGNTNPYWMMAKLPARAMQALHAAAAADGITLSSTGRTRTYQQQVTLFLARHEVVSYAVYSTLPASGGYRRVWDGKYWKLKAGMAAAAPPSYSAPHVTGCCDDLAEIVNGELVGLRVSTQQWLYANAPRFGWRWSLTSEPWHVQWVEGDNVPTAVAALSGAATGAVQPPIEANPTTGIPDELPPPAFEEDMDMPFIIKNRATGQPALVYGDGKVTGLSGDDVAAYEAKFGPALVTAPEVFADFASKPNQ